MHDKRLQSLSQNHMWHKHNESAWQQRISLDIYKPSIILMLIADNTKLRWLYLAVSTKETWPTLQVLPQLMMCCTWPVPLFPQKRHGQPYRYCHSWWCDVPGLSHCFHKRDMANLTGTATVDDVMYLACPHWTTVDNILPHLVQEFLHLAKCLVWGTHHEG